MLKRARRATSGSKREENGYFTFAVSTAAHRRGAECEV